MIEETVIPLVTGPKAIYNPWILFPKLREKLCILETAYTFELVLRTDSASPSLIM